MKDFDFDVLENNSGKKFFIKKKYELKTPLYAFSESSFIVATIIKLLGNNKCWTLAKIQANLGLDEDAVEQNLVKMKDAGVVSIKYDQTTKCCKYLLANAKGLDNSGCENIKREGGLTPREQTVLDHVRKNPGATSKTVAEYFKVTTSTAGHYLRSLHNKNKIIRRKKTYNGDGDYSPFYYEANYD